MSTVTFAPTFSITMRTVTPITTSSPAQTLGVPTTGRKSLEIQNIGANPIAIGLSTATTYVTGRQIPAGQSWALDLADTITLYAIASGGSSTVIFTEIK
jgi:hypothetical protein